MKITAKLLKKLGCCEDGIKIAKKEKLIPCNLKDVDVHDLAFNKKVNFCSLAMGLVYYNSDLGAKWRDKADNDIYSFNSTGYANTYRRTFCIAIDDVDSPMDRIILPVIENTPVEYFEWQERIGNLCVEILKEVTE